MKQLKCFLIVAAVALTVMSCQKTVEVSFENTTQEIGAQGGSIELALKSNGDWTIEPTVEWLTINPMSGKGDATLTLIAEANTMGESRTAEVKATTKDNIATLTLTQGAAEEYVNVTPKEILCGSEGGEFVVELSTTVDWTVSAPEWIVCTPNEGSGDASITLRVNPVDGDFSGDREAEVLFGDLNISDKIHVVQTVDPVLGIEITPNNLNFVCTGETKTVSVTTEDSWTASASEDWVTLSQTEGQGDAEISVTVAENPIYIDRAAIVRFSTASGVHAILTIIQEATPDPHFLEVSPLVFEFGNEGGERTLTIGCDTDWGIDLDCPWLSISQLTGTGNATVVLTADQNELNEPRSYVFHIKSGDLNYELTVRQAAGDVPLVAAFDSDTLFVAYTGGMQHVQLTSNTTWLLQVSEWISLITVSSGDGDASFDILVDNNLAPDDRVGFVKAVHAGQVLATLVVVQEGRPDILETDYTEVDVRPEGGDYVIQVTANQKWTVATNEEWMRCNPQSGFGNGSFTITVDALPSPRPRTGYIKVSGSTGAQVMITVNQH